METKEIIKKLKEYQVICNDAIDKAREAKIQDAVNWSDLLCYETLYCLSADGDYSYQFIISEASPDCNAFSDFIADYILDRVPERTPIKIITEW